MSTRATTHTLGYPRIGERRELKKATEAFWKDKITRDALEATGRELRRTAWQKQQAAGIDWIACNDFSFYDQVLDMTCLLGNVPPRFNWEGGPIDLNTMFQIARGRGRDGEAETTASEMTKWFDTNYHYLVPEFSPETTFELLSAKVFDEFSEAQALGIDAKPVLIGPITYLMLGKTLNAETNFNCFSLLPQLIAVYETILERLAAQGAQWIQLDEPVFSLDLTAAQLSAMKESYDRLHQAAGSAKLLVASYFGPLCENLDTYLSLKVDGLHIDAVRGANEIEQILARFPEDKILSLGIVDGRNIWKNDYAQSLELLKKARTAVGSNRLWVTSSCSLLHTPITLENEPSLDPELKSWMAFADQKLEELADLRALLDGEAQSKQIVNQAAHEARRTSTRIHQEAVKQRLASIQPADLQRDSAYAERSATQRTKLDLPIFPTTTIGSFPQTREVRQARAKFKKGELSASDYDTFLKEETRHCIEKQEAIGLDMLVHGEFERNDMVEYFGEQLDGFAFTKNGWVQSYGSRYVKPPIIFGDVSRTQAMTVDWAQFAQSLTSKPMKGMLTGPVTILQWSFVRDDQPREITTKQIAFAIRDEVCDLEAANIAAIQIDEAAFREGLPLRRSDWQAYLRWAVDSFRIASSGVRDDTQIHTHMCYSEFNDTIEAIAEMDADVITIETSRSNLELLDAFVDFHYPNEIGPGVYDIHSPRIPSSQEMEQLMGKALGLIDPNRLWVNPDCGLKTRAWEEAEAALRNMVNCAQNLRKTHHAG